MAFRNQEKAQREPVSLLSAPAASLLFLATAAGTWPVAADLAFENSPVTLVLVGSAF